MMCPLHVEILVLPFTSEKQRKVINIEGVCDIGKKSGRFERGKLNVGLQEGKEN